MAFNEKLFALFILGSVTFFSCGSEEAEQVAVNKKPVAEKEVIPAAAQEESTKTGSIPEETTSKANRPDLLEIYVQASEEDLEGPMFPDGNTAPATNTANRESQVEASENKPVLTKKGAVQTSKGRAVMSFEDKRFKYGMIMQGDKIEHDFKFVNKGKEELVVTGVDASCGCTQPSYPFIPIPPGETGIIGVVFNSTGKLGPQKSTVTVRTNAGTHKLYLEGFVDAEREKPKEVKTEVKEEVKKENIEEGAPKEEKG